MRKKHARDIPDFSHKQPQLAKHGVPAAPRETAPTRQQQRPIVTPKPVAKPNRRGQ